MFLFWIVPTCMAFVGFHTQRVIQRRLFSGGDVLRFRLVELALLFLLVKLVSHADDTLSELGQALSLWFRQPLAFFNARALIAYFIGVVGWLVGGATARDLDALTDPSVYVGETPAMVRLLRRYYFGAGLLLVFSALTRVRLPDVFRVQQGRPPSTLGHALLYFFVGLFVLGGIQFAHLVSQWQSQRVVIGKGLEAAWLRYTLLLVGLGALIAFVLPTGYTVGLLDVVAAILVILSFLATVLYMILVWPFALLFAWLMGEPTAAPPQIQSIPLELPTGGEGGGTHPWWAFLRSLLFWLVFVGSAGYLIYIYLRDRLHLMSTIVAVKPLAWLREVWYALRRWWLSFVRRTRVALPGLIGQLRLSRPRPSQVAGSQSEARALTLRERLCTLYLQTLAVADEKGVPRHSSQTPYEYQAVLSAYVSVARDAWRRLTEAFVLARYSTHPVTPAKVEASESDANRVQEALRAAISGGNSDPSHD